MIEVWSADDEKTGCSVVVEYDSPRILYIVTVTKGEKKAQRELSALHQPKSRIHEKDLLRAKHVAVLLAEEITKEN